MYNLLSGTIGLKFYLGNRVFLITRRRLLHRQKRPLPLKLLTHSHIILCTHTGIRTGMCVCDGVCGCMRMWV